MIVCKWKINSIFHTKKGANNSNKPFENDMTTLVTVKKKSGLFVCNETRGIALTI